MTDAECSALSYYRCTNNYAACGWRAEAEKAVGCPDGYVMTDDGCRHAEKAVGCPDGYVMTDDGCQHAEKAVGHPVGETQVGSQECRWCDCYNWSGNEYSQCSPIENQAAGTYHTVKCREDGVTPMSGHWTNHAAECAKYSGDISWVVGDAGDGKSCDAICGDRGLACWREGLEIATKTELSSVCLEVAGWSGTAKGNRDIRPHTNTQTQACYGYDQWDNYPASCSAVPTDPIYARICSCLYTYE